MLNKNFMFMMIPSGRSSILKSKNFILPSSRANAYPNVYPVVYPVVYPLQYQQQNLVHTSNLHLNADKEKSKSHHQIQNNLELVQRKVGDKWKQFQVQWKNNEFVPTWMKGKPDQDVSSEWYTKKVSFWMKRYEDFVGLTEVKAAQAKVVELERAFIESQEVRRQAQAEIREVQEKIKQIHSELEKTHRGEDRYLTLVTQEHQILKTEINLIANFQNYERRERECFAVLSNAVRDSHEQERAQAEKTKYWSIIGSVIGTCLGILGTTINNRMRMKELRELVSKASSTSSGERLLSVTDQMGRSLEMHEQRLKDLVDQVQHVITDSKISLSQIGEMREMSTSLKCIIDNFNVKNLQTNTNNLLKQCEHLHKSISQEQKSSMNLIRKLSETTQAQKSMLEGFILEQSLEKSKLVREVSEKDKILHNSLVSLYNNQANIMTTFTASNDETGQKVQKVLNVLTSLQASSTARHKKEQKLLQTLDASLLNQIEDALDDHEIRLRRTTMLTGVLVAFLTPALILAFNKL